MNININQYRDKAYDLANQLRDVRLTGQLLFVGVVLLISWSGVKTIQTNYELQKQISALDQQNTVHALENKNLELQNDYYKTDEYLELSARRNFGLGKPGEKEVLVPQSVAYTYAPDVSSEVAVAPKPARSSNFQAWINFFLNRPSVQ